MAENKKLFAAIPPYLAVWAGLFLYKSAWAALIGFHVAILVSLLILKARLPISMLFQSASIKWILLSVLICMPSGYGVYIFRNLFVSMHDLPHQLLNLGLDSSSWPVFIAYFTIVNPFMEEYFWRGALGSDIKTFYIGDVVYAGYHAMILVGKTATPFIIFAVIILSIVGWFWRQVSRKDRGLFAAILGHMAADFSILFAIYSMTN